MAFIEIVEGLNKGTILRLCGDTLIGRAPTNALCLPDRRASREHAVIKSAGGGFAIEDLGSANGTSVNGVNLAKAALHPLRDGDEIIVCSTRMIYRESEAIPGVRATPEEPPPPVIDRDANTNIVPRPATDPGSGSVGHVLDASQDLGKVRDHEKTTREGLLEASRRLQAMISIASLIAETTDQKVLLDRIMDTLFEILPQAHRALILLVDGRDGDLSPAVARNRSAPPDKGDSFFAVSRTILGSVMERRQSILSIDAAGDFGATDSIVDLSIRSMMCAPLICKGEILGILHVDITSLDGSFTPEDLAILTGIAAQAAIALKSLTLFARVAEIARLTNPGAAEGIALPKAIPGSPKMTLKG